MQPGLSLTAIHEALDGVSSEPCFSCPEFILDEERWLPAGFTSSLQRDELVHFLRYLTTLGVDSVRDGIKLPAPKTNTK
jgi:hypothetical protein